MIFINNSAFSYVFVLVLCLLITAICSVSIWLLACVCLVSRSLSFTLVTKLVLSISLSPVSHCREGERLCVSIVVQWQLSTNHASLALLMFSLMMAMYWCVLVCVCLLLLYIMYTALCARWYVACVYLCLTFSWNNIIEWNYCTARIRQKECFHFSFSRSPHTLRCFAKQKEKYKKHKTIVVNCTSLCECECVCNFDYDFFFFFLFFKMRFFSNNFFD